MKKSKINNVGLIFVALFYKTFTETIITIPNDIDDNEIVLGCLLFCFTVTIIMLALVMLIGYLITNFIIL